MTKEAADSSNAHLETPDDKEREIRKELAAATSRALRIRLHGGVDPLAKRPSPFAPKDGRSEQR